MYSLQLPAKIVLCNIRQPMMDFGKILMCVFLCAWNLFLSVSFYCNALVVWFVFIWSNDHIMLYIIQVCVCTLFLTRRGVYMMCHDGPDRGKGFVVLANGDNPAVLFQCEVCRYLLGLSGSCIQLWRLRNLFIIPNNYHMNSRLIGI